MGIEFKKASIKDLDEVYRIEKSTFDPVKYHLNSKSDYRHLLTKGNAEIFLIQVDGKNAGVGVVLYRQTSKLARFYSLAIDPNFQGRSLATKFYDYIENYLKAKKYVGILGEIRVDNEPYLSRVKERGYQKIRDLVEYYPDGCLGVKLKKLF